jgi:predicted Zn-dependent peptidase
VHHDLRLCLEVLALISKLIALIAAALFFANQAFAANPPKRAVLYVGIPDATEFSLRYYIPIGSIHEKVPGLAHYVEHMVFKHDGGRAINALNRIPGASSNATTQHQATSYLVNTPEEGFALALAFFASLHQPIKLTPQDIELERGIVLQEIAQRTESDPDTPFSMEYNEALFKGSFTAKWPGGTAEDIRGVKLSDVTAFVDEHYIGAPSFLLIVGPPANDARMQVIKSAFADAQIGVIKVNGPGKLEFETDAIKDYPGLFPPDPPALIEPAHVLREGVSKRSTQDSFSFARLFLAPTDERMRFASLILNDALTSRLPEGLLEPMVEADDAMLSSVYIGLNDVQGGLWSLTFWGTPLAGVKREDIKKRVESYLADLAKNGISEKSFNRLKARYFLRVPWDNPSNRAEYAATDMMNYGYEHAINWREKMNQVTHADVQALATWLTRADRTGEYFLKAQE